MPENLIRDLYGLHPTHIRKSGVGAGSDTYFVSCTEGRYVLKYPSVSGINHPEQEPTLCGYLLTQGIPVSRFVPNRNGSCLSQDGNGRLCTLQQYIPGKTPDWNTASDALLWAQAELLGKIHAALRAYPQTLPEGIGVGFFRYMTPERVLPGFQRSLETACSLGDDRSASELRFRIALLEKYPAANFDLSRLTVGNTHGDYFISQLLCDGDSICAVIDWTCACVHPLIWELVRSYVYAAPECAAGELDPGRFAEYAARYTRYAPLADYDRRCMLPLYCYQIAVCDYYGQYYASKAGNRAIYLEQARLATRFLRKQFPEIAPPPSV